MHGSFNIQTTLLEILLLLLLFRCRIVRNVVFILVQRSCGRVFSRIHRLIGKFNNSYFFTKIIESHHENSGALFCMQSLLSFTISNIFGFLNRIVSIFLLIWKIYTIDTSQWWNKINEFAECRPNKMTASNSLCILPLLVRWRFLRKNATMFVCLHKDQLRSMWIYCDTHSHTHSHSLSLKKDGTKNGQPVDLLFTD